MPVGLIERFAANTLDLTAVEPEVGRRIVPGRTAQGGLLAVEDHEQERRGPSPAALLPRRPEESRARRGPGRGHDDLEGVDPVPEGQPNLVEGGGWARCLSEWDPLEEAHACAWPSMRVFGRRNSRQAGGRTQPSLGGGQ